MRAVPYRSARDAVIGVVSPHMTAWTPIASEKSPTSNAVDSVIGSSRSPKIFRAPKLINRMIVPQVRTTAGVRQELFIGGVFPGK